MLTLIFVNFQFKMNPKGDSGPQLAKACVIPICEGKKFNLVHKFPADIQRNTEWQNAIQKYGPIAKLQNLTPDAIRKRYFICARHFGVSSYKNIESRSLNLTAIPHINLNNLDEYKLSKAYQLEQSQHIESSPKKQAPTILNKLANSSMKIESEVKAVKRSFNEIHENMVTVLNISSPQKQSPIIHEPKIRKIEVLPQKDDSPKEEPKKNLPEEEPKGKLLALLEVNSVQYKKLLSVINTNSNVVVIDSPEEDLNTSADNGKRFFSLVN